MKVKDLIKQEQSMTLDELQAKKLIKVLLLEPDKNGFYQTEWGKKTEVGLIATILTIMNGKLSIKELEE